MTKEERAAELRRLNRRLISITIGVVAVALGYAALPKENLFPLVLWLVRHVGLTYNAAFILVLANYGVRLVLMLLVLIIVFRTFKEMVQIGCVECGVSNPKFSLNPRRTCPNCGARYSDNRP